MEEAGLALKRTRVSIELDIAKCIIFQSVIADIKPSGTEKGRQNVIAAAALRGDEVYERLSKADHSSFVYHITNKC